MKKDMLNTYFNISRNKNGFTMIELLIAMATTAIISAGVYSVYQSQQKAQLGQKQVIEMQQSLRVALYIMTNEIRMAGYDPDGTNGVGIISAGDGSNGNPFVFSFLADDDCIDNDGDSSNPTVCTDPNVDEAGEIQHIEYDLYDSYADGDTDIGRKVSAGGSRNPIAENIQNLQFVYFDGDGNITATLADIRSVKITIEATIDANEKNYFQGNNRTLTTTIKLRNLGL
jgi:type IV pilus assembly protein PilW